MDFLEPPCRSAAQLWGSLVRAGLPSGLDGNDQPPMSLEQQRDPYLIFIHSRSFCAVAP